MRLFLTMQQVNEALIRLHGRPGRAVDPLSEHCGGQTLVLDSLIRTLLFQNTTDITSIRAFKILKERFPTWEGVLQASNEDIEDAIRVGGLAAIKCERMKTLLATIKEEQGKCCLEWLRDEPTEAIKSFLTRFKGIGPKTISCILLFSLSRSDFPVDTHVHHISKSLHWCPNNCSREQCYEHLNLLVPDDVKYELHVLMVQHGKACSACGKREGKEANKNQCPLVEFKKLKGKNANIDMESTMDPVKEEQEEHKEKKAAGKKRLSEPTAKVGTKKTKIKVEEIKMEDINTLTHSRVAVKKEEAN